MIPHGVGKGDLTLNGTFDMAGFSQSLNGLSGSGTVENTVGGSSILTVGNDNDITTFSGTIANSSGSVALTKVGSGTFTLTGGNSHSGGTTNSAGTLRLGSATALGTGAITLSGGKLTSVGSTPRTIANNLVVTANSSLGDAADNGRLTFSGTVDLTGLQRDLTINSDVFWTGSVLPGGAIGKYGPATLYLQGATADFNTDTTTKDGAIVIDNAAITQSAGAFRVNADTLLARLVLTNGGSLVIPSTRLRVGYSNGSALATNIVDIAGTLDLQAANGDNGKVRMGDKALRAIVNLRTNGLLRIRGFDPGPNATEVSFDGGTLQANAGPDANVFMQGLTVASVRARGAIVDTAEQSIRIGQALLGGGGNGGLVVLGYGRLSLNGTNTYTGSTVVSNGTLGGNGVISGPVLVTAGSELSPGNSVGTLTVSNTVTLAANATCTMELNRANVQLCDKLVANTINASGPLVVANIGGTLLSGDSFDLFDATTLSLSFSSVTLPPLLTGLSWNTNQLAVNGTIQVTGTAVPPQISSAVLSGTDLVMSGSGGIADTKYYVLASTNVALPLTSWTSIATNPFDGIGNFSFTSTVADPGTPQRFFKLQLP